MTNDVPKRAALYCVSLDACASVCLSPLYSHDVTLNLLAPHGVAALENCFVADSLFAIECWHGATYCLADPLPAEKVRNKLPRLLGRSCLALIEQVTALRGTLDAGIQETLREFLPGKAPLSYIDFRVREEAELFRAVTRSIVMGTVDAWNEVAARTPLYDVKSCLDNVVAGHDYGRASLHQLLSKWRQFAVTRRYVTHKLTEMPTLVQCGAPFSQEFATTLGLWLMSGAKLWAMERVVSLLPGGSPPISPSQPRWRGDGWSDAPARGPVELSALCARA